MYSIKLRRRIIIGLVCLLVFINATPVQAQPETKAPSLQSVNNLTSTTSSSSSSTCVVCGAPPPCPSCPSGQICVLDLQTCNKCPTPQCRSQNLVPNVPIPTTNSDNSGGSSKLIPAVIGSVFGVGVLTAAGFGYMLYTRRRGGHGEKLDKCSTDSEFVIPIAYIPPDTPTTPRPEPAYPRTRTSYLSVGTTPLTSPLASPLPRTHSDERLLSLTEDDDVFSEVGTVLQATKATASTGSAMTVMTATRVKPALVRLNTVKSNSNLSARSCLSNQTTPKTPHTGNSLLSMHSSNKSSMPNSPNSFHSTDIGDEEGILLPRIDIERSSLDSSNNANSTILTPNHNQTGTPNHLTSPFLDPMEGRQSFGLFGSDEVDSSSSQIERTSLMSSTSSNPRSTMMSDDGDGEIMIFWGGSAPTPLSNDRNSTGTTNDNAKGLTNHSNKVDESKKETDKIPAKTESNI